MKTVSRQKNNTSNITIELGRIIRNRKKRKSPKAIVACLEQINKCRQQEAELPEEDKNLKQSDDTIGIMKYLEKRYLLRYNTVMGYTEYKRRDDDSDTWKPADKRAVNSFTFDARANGINVWDKDITRYLQSDKIPDYNPVTDYLNSVRKQWDGQDHIGMLAKTVKTNCQHWEKWFRTWLLAMVAQWTGKNKNYGNSVAPLLISGQGYNKSTFCRSLLPPCLQWGYTDNMSVDNKKSLMHAMAEMLLINLDEFNQISARNQEGFLKNLIQLASVKAKRPYGKHVEELPRLASFIATTNITDSLADPTGNRRFIGIELTQPIDVTTPPNHNQLYAQVMHLLDKGECYWFDAEQTQLIMSHNRQFQAQEPAMICFNDMFEPCADEHDGQWCNTAIILTRLRKRYGSAMVRTNMIGFGRMLTNVPTLLRRRTGRGTLYLVKERS